MIPTLETRHRLRIAREAAGFKSATIASELGVQRQTVSNYENGHTTPDVRTLRAWSHVTGVPLWWLMGEPEPRPPVMAGGGGLPLLDSNQQPAGYGSTGISSLADKRAKVSQVRQMRSGVIPNTSAA